MNLVVIGLMLSFLLVPPGETRRDIGNCPTPAVRNGAARLKKRGKMVKYRCFRRFSLIGPQTAICLGGIWFPSNPPDCVGTGCMPRPPVRNAEKTELEMLNNVAVARGSVVKYTCLPGHTMIGDAVTWCDGMLWNASAPECSPPLVAPKMSCGFEEDATPLCDWEQSDSDDFDWTRFTRTTPTSNTGPPGAYDGDYYIYAEASSRLENDTARIISPIYSANYSIDTCLRLALHMAGADEGTFRVGIGDEGFQSNVQILEQIRSNLGGRWQIVLVELPPRLDDFQIFIDAVIGRSYLSDIAIDALALLNGSECIEAKKTYRRPQPISSRIQSPSSCWMRCGRNESVTMTSMGWSEGICRCTAACAVLPRDCCSDYLDECGIGKAAPRIEVETWVTWSMVGGILSLAIVVVIILLSVIRWHHQPLRSRLHSDDESEDLASIVQQDDLADALDEEPAGRARVQRRSTPGAPNLRSHVESIDFSLVLASEANEETEGNSKAQQEASQPTFPLEGMGNIEWPGEKNSAKMLSTDPWGPPPPVNPSENSQMEAQPAEDTNPSKSADCEAVEFAQTEVVSEASHPAEEEVLAADSLDETVGRNEPEIDFADGKVTAL